MKHAILALAILTLSSCARTQKKHGDCLMGNPTACYSLEIRCMEGSAEACKLRDDLPLAQKRALVFELERRGMVRPAWASALPAPTEEESGAEARRQAALNSIEQQKHELRKAAASAPVVNNNLKQNNKVDCTSTRIGNQVTTNCR